MHQSYSALIVDDEKPARDVIQKFLEEFCPEIDTIHTSSSVNDAAIILQKENIDIIFLDVHVAHENGFDLLTQINPVDYAIIFVTAFAEYTYRALKASALDYLLKPLDIEEFKVAVIKSHYR